MGKTLASVMTTPADPNKKRHDVEIKKVKLATYKINLRSFHPNTQFEAKGFFFHGDNRGFSLKNSFFNQNNPNQIPNGSTTSRVWSRFNINLAQIHKSQSLPKPTVQSNPSGPLKTPFSLPIVGPIKLLGHDEDYADDKYKPSGKLDVLVPDIKFDSPRSFNFTSHYSGKNHAFLFSRAAYDATGKSFVPDLDVRHELMIRIERINKYMDIISLVYGDGFPNTEGFIEDAKGNKIFLGTHIRIGTPATHLFGDNKRLMWANAIRIGLKEDGSFGNILWVFAQGLGGPKEHRDEYGFIKEIKGNKTIVVSNPFGDRPGSFFWNFQQIDAITKKNYKAPFRFKINIDLSAIENQLFECFKTPPILKTTIQAWNEMFLKQDPNEGRSKALFQLDDSKWEKK